MVNETNKVLELPILKHFEKTDISFNPQNWRKGEKGIATIVGIVLLGTIAWGLYSFILPIVFTWVGQALGAIAAAVLVIAFFYNVAGNNKGTEKAGKNTAQNADKIRSVWRAGRPEAEDDTKPRAVQTSKSKDKSHQIQHGV